MKTKFLIILSLILSQNLSGQSNDVPKIIIDTLEIGSTVFFIHDEVEYENIIVADYNIDDNEQDTVYLYKQTYESIVKDEIFCESKNSKIGIVGGNSFSLVLDQDVLAGKLNEDRDYTQGLEMKWSGEGTNSNYLVLPFLHYGIDQIPKLITKKKVSQYHLLNHSISVGFSGFTPFELDTTGIITNDRPYAALLYFKTTRSSLHDNKKILYNSEFSMGVFGGFTGEAAKFIQTAIHSGQRASSNDPDSVRPDPLGWDDNQLSDGGSFLINYRGRFYYNFSKHDYFEYPERTRVIPKFNYAIAPFIGWDVGFYTNISTGVNLKLGFYSSDLEVFDTEGFIYEKGDVNEFENIEIIKKPSCKSMKLFQVYGVLKMNTSLWLHNSTLSGWYNRSKDPFYVPYQDIRKMTFEVETGMGITLNDFSLSYTFMLRSRETNLVKRNHAWGRINIIIKDSIRPKKKRK